MTEDEAKTKWCPFTRYASRNGMAINRWANDEDTNRSPEPAKCIGSACMAWRWSETAEQTTNREARLGTASFAMGVLGSAEQRKENMAQIMAKRLGYCGLAGRE